MGRAGRVLIGNGRMGGRMWAGTKDAYGRCFFNDDCMRCDG
jgi:hypothetical protein